jgi:hypothetical protein
MAGGYVTLTPAGSTASGGVGTTVQTCGVVDHRAARASTLASRPRRRASAARQNLAMQRERVALAVVRLGSSESRERSPIASRFTRRPLRGRERRCSEE